MNQDTLLQIQYPIHQLNIETGIDEINHFSCIPKEIRTSNDAIRYYQEILQRWIDDGNIILVYSNGKVENFEEELGILDFVTETHFVNESTLWKEYSKLINTIIESTPNAKENQIKTAISNTLIQCISDLPSTKLEDCVVIWDQLIEIQKKIQNSKIEATEYGIDYLKDLWSFIFQSVLPYKFHAYGMLDKYYQINANSENIIKSFSTNYLELLVRMLFGEIQSIRGTSVITNAKLKNIILLGYFLLSDLYPKNLDMEKINVVGNYVRLMLSSGVSEYVTTKIYQLYKSPSEYLDLVSDLKPGNSMLQLIEMRQYRNSYTKMDHPVISRHSLNATWGNWVIVGEGFFSDKNLLVHGMNGISVNENFIYMVLNTTAKVIQSYISCESIAFQISEDCLGYLKNEIHADLCTLTNTDTGKKRYLAAIPEGIYELFTIDDSKDVYGIGIVEAKNHNRQVIKFGADKSEYRYKLILGGES